jgi:CheY-like chemotaxis protein
VNVHVDIGPVPSASARRWVETAREVLDGVRVAGDALPVELPPEVERAFIDYLDEWDAVAAANDPFRWSADVDADYARQLVVYFFSLLSIDDELWAAHRLPFTPEEAQPFIDALSSSVLDALAAVDSEVAPSIKASWPTGEIHRPWRAEPGRLFRVVIVDDTEDVRLLLRMTLNIDGRFELVGTAVNGREGIEVCREQQPDGVILDVMMPVLDGISALPEIRAACPGARIVMLSANDHPDLVRGALAGGADAFVTKGSALDVALEALLADGDGPDRTGLASRAT